VNGSMSKSNGTLLLVSPSGQTAAANDDQSP
jgi:hypothetical protein